MFIFFKLTIYSFSIVYIVYNIEIEYNYVITHLLTTTVLK